jgi:hypothetical protein
MHGKLNEIHQHLAAKPDAAQAAANQNGQDIKDYVPAG